MSKQGLEKIVAGLELCKLIPAGEFDDTALVWIFDHQSARKSYPETAKDDIFFFVEDRNFATDVMDTVKWAVNRPPMYSATTAEEIMKKLDAPGLWRGSDGKWRCFCKDHMSAQKGGTIADAVLRLWLRVKGIESK